MNNVERRRIRSIPPRTMVDVLRVPITIRIGTGSLGNARRVPQRETWVSEERGWSEVVQEHLYIKPRRERATLEPFYERDEKIEWQAEVIEDYNSKGDLGIILELAGIGGLTEASFKRGVRDYGPDTTLFYSSISYNKKRTLLLLVTTRDIFKSTTRDIFKLQVADQMDVNPLFQGKLYLPQLATTYNPASMDVRQNNGLVIVSYNRR